MLFNTSLQKVNNAIAQAVAPESTKGKTMEMCVFHLRPRNAILGILTEVEGVLKKNKEEYPHDTSSNSPVPTAR